EHGIERRQGWPIESLSVYCEVFEVPEGQDVAAVIERLVADPRVDLVQPMNTFEALAEGYDDPYVRLQSAAAELGVAGAHRLATGKGVVVAVVDTAVDATHPELDGRIAVERDFVDSRRKPRAAEVHGTAVAGVIASVANNSEGIVGVAPDVRLAALRACWSVEGDSGGARCSSFTLAQALEAAMVVDAAVVNMSLAGPEDPLLTRLIDEAVARGIVVVAAAPAAADRTPFPASHGSVLVGRSSSASDARGSAMHLPAPAEEILTTIPGAGYAFFSGTSLAAAHLSGVIALMIEREPSLEAGRIADVLAASMVSRADRTSVNACYAVQSLTDLRVCAPAFEFASSSGGDSTQSPSRAERPAGTRSPL
ncbi:MAG: S8 family serine peptidase, partial [Gammaproteobacteria bacterium]|nr:S8 family serine peptidase [Gammaproteobacteria bacterium]